jgi:hypothetical protein
MAMSSCHDAIGTRRFSGSAADAGSVIEFGAAIWRPLVATLMMCLSVAGILNWLHGHGTSHPFSI